MSITVKDLLKRTLFYKYYHNYMLNKISRENKLRNYYFQLEGCELLNNFSIALNDAGIVFWLEFGSLLGYYRDNDFIKHDNDIDIGAYIDDASKIRNALIRAGFKLVHSYKSSIGGIEDCFKYRHTCIDVFYFNRDLDRGTIYCNTFSTHRCFLQSLRKRLNCSVIRADFPYGNMVRANFKGSLVYVPENAKEHLEWSYGKNFMTPDPNYNAKDVATNGTYYSYEEVQGVLTVYDKKC